MRKGFLGSIAALTAGAGVAWGQPVAPPAPSGSPALPAATAPGEVPPPPARVPLFGGLPQYATPGNAGYAPPPAILPPGNFGPPNDPVGLGPVGGFGPPPGPMYPMPGPYSQQSYQPAPPMPNVGDGAGGGFGSAPRWWFDAEYLLWFNRGQRPSYPLVTSSAPSDAGIPGSASTTVLSGYRTLGYGAMNGLRFEAGFFGDADRRFGFEMSGFMTERRANVQVFGGLDDTAGIPTLARPYIDTSGVSNAIVLSGPSLGPAIVRVATTNSNWGIEPEGVWNIYRAEPGTRSLFSVNLVAGYRFIQVKEELIVESATSLSTGALSPTFTTGAFGVITQGTSTNSLDQTNFGGVTVTGPAVLNVRDSFRTTNQFNGFVLGLTADARYGIFTANGYAKVAVGDMHERVEVFGGSSFTSQTNTSTSVTFVGQNGAAYGGVLANASNIGTYLHDRFDYIPEVGGKIGIAITRGLTGYIGGNFLYFPDVVRPGSIATPVASSAAIPFSSNYGTAGATRALNSVTFSQEKYWLGGLTFGFTLTY